MQFVTKITPSEGEDRGLSTFSKTAGKLVFYFFFMTFASFFLSPFIFFLGFDYSEQIRSDIPGLSTLFLLPVISILLCFGFIGVYIITSRQGSIVALVLAPVMMFGFAGALYFLYLLLALSPIALVVNLGVLLIPILILTLIFKSIGSFWRETKALDLNVTSDGIHVLLENGTTDSFTLAEIDSIVIMEGLKGAYINSGRKKASYSFTNIGFGELKERLGQVKSFREAISHLESSTGDKEYVRYTSL